MKVEICTFDIDDRDEVRLIFSGKPLDLPLHNPIYDKLKLIIFHQKHGNTRKRFKNTLLTIYIQWKQCQTLLQTRQKINTMGKRSAKQLAFDSKTPQRR